MCGFAGFFDPTGQIPRDALEPIAREMAATLAHRGPDDGGTWADPDARIALGHRRLSIIDLSPLGHQPMVSHCGRYVIAYNGEIYNYPELRRALGEGLPWRGHSDTEVLLAAIARWGLTEALERSNGMFAFALWDRSERRLHLARDCFGEKPLYYGWAGRAFLFGSELKALRRHPLWDGAVDREALALYLRHNYVPAPYSIHRGIRKLSPGCTLTLGPDCPPGALPSPAAYWSARDRAVAALSDPYRGDRAQAADELEALLLDAVSLRLVADVPLGAFLSGGVDSSLVVALMQRCSERPVKTFSVGFHERGFNEADHARAVAGHLGTDHTELYVAPEEAMAVIPSLPSIYDEPFADSSQIPTHLVAKLARERVTVSLSGDGGDELFGGYNRYFWGRNLWRAMAPMPAGLRSRLARAIRRLPPERWDRLFGAVHILLPRALRQPRTGHKLHKIAGLLAADTPRALYRALVSHWQNPGELVIGGDEPPITWDDGRDWETGPAFVQGMMLLDTLGYLPDDILVKVDRASMGVSLESRVPLLDHRLFEFAWRLPLGMKLHGNEGKAVLREVLDRYVPRRLIERPKMGFGVPLGEWLRGPLRPWADALLDPERLRSGGFLRPEPILSAWAEHLSGERDGSYPIWDILMFQSWLEQWGPGGAA